MPDTIINLKTWQARFIRSTKRFPAMVGGWGIGKDLCSISRGMYLSEKYPGNRGLIARLEATDLADSTIKDFREYTGLTVDSHRNAYTPNKSEIMFRHLEELTENNLNNMNLGWFCLIQADEIETDSIFLKLCGRLRKCNGCGKRPCLCYQSGFISANVNAEDWISNLWGSPELGINGKLEDSELIEARTHDNADILSVAFIKSLEEVKRNRPEMYDRFVLNSRKVTSDKFVVLSIEIINGVVNWKIPVMPDQTMMKKVTVCDPAEGDTNLDDDTGEGGGDETVIYDFENGKVVGQEIYNDFKLMDTVGRIQAHAYKNKSNMICVDKIGVGAGVYSRLEEIYQGNPEMEIYGFDSRITPPGGIDEETYANYKTYAWFKARDKYFIPRMCSLPDDPILKRQLSMIRYRYTSGGRGGKYILESKKRMKKILGCSPDRADAYIMGMDALSRAKFTEQNEVTGDAWMHPRFRKNAYAGGYR
jgi:hypothetical protein